MSWNAYIDSMKTADQSGTAPVAQAAICGCTSGQESVWAGTLQVTADEIKKLCASDRSSFAQNGVYIAGRRCRLIRDQLDVDPMFAMDVKTAADAEGNTYSICVGKTKQAIVIAMGTKDASGGQVSNKVHTVVEHLRKAGY
ncbi:profilin-1-like [Archocentrus centrarchus]|uniref:profilin-1-like n=1 Tax=Archocentrus centrarchus TaxID=63155 RepID=UPI0011E9C0C2|nr:profilin-1-like [Archocentrus centrarchus]XP_030580683.1 profilin-1-like [Archocentrus centrarchus]